MHYLDYAATTPVPAAVAQRMTAVLTEGFGNPSSRYLLGRETRKAMEADRAVIAGALGCDSRRLFFTSCGTEGDNWAIRSALWQNRRVGKHIVTTAVEHSAVVETMKALQAEGYEVTWLKPDSQGRITAGQVTEALREDTALVSMMLVNNETGAIFPVAEVAAALRGWKTLLHTDAVQAFLKIPFTAASLGADYITISGHKLGGPKGIGALYIGDRVPHPRPLLYGGGQEQGIRPGTEPTAQIAGFAAGVSLWLEDLESRRQHLAACRDYAWERLSKIDTLERIGTAEAPHILSVSLPGYPSQNIVNDLSDQGIYVSAGSACHQGKLSHVLTAMNLPKRTATGTIRVSFGPDTTFEDIDALYEALLAHKTNRFPML